VENGVFAGITDQALVATSNGVKSFKKG